MDNNMENLNKLEAESARKRDLLDQMNKLKFNNINSEEVTNDIFNDITSNEEPKVIESKVESTVDINTNSENNMSYANINAIEIEKNDEQNIIVEPIQNKENNEKYNDCVKFPDNPIEVSYFDGKLLDLMGWNFLRIILTIATLGIGYSWGECLYLKYKLSHTVLNGKRIKFEGEGSELFVEQFKWTFLTIITLGIYSFWVPIKRINWIVSKLHFEDEEYKIDNTFFCGSMLHLLGINILCSLITIISFGLLYPLAECIKMRWLARNTVLNNKRVIFKGKTLNLYGKYILWTLLTIITLGIYSFWLSIKKIDWEVQNTELL